MSSRALPFLIASLLPAAACIDEVKGLEEDAPAVDGKDDSLRKPTDHGAIGFDAPQVQTINADAGHHAWTFALTGAADVDLFTGKAVASQKQVDTVLYLYRQKADGSWGSYLARNDDVGGSLWSSIDRSLTAGVYRVLVKGYDHSVKGKFAVTVHCDGAGCAVPDAACVLGDSYREIETQPGLQLINRNKVTVATPWLDDAWKQRIVIAVQQSSHTDVTTVEEAFDRVDQHEMNISWYAEPAARRQFVAIEYGAGDNSYGAVFGVGTELVASIHDGDLEGCETPAEVCLLPETYGDLMTGDSYVHGATRTITAAGQVSGVEADQVLRTLQHIYGAEITSLAQGLGFPDDDKVLVTPLTHRATGTAVTAVEFGAGDTSVGLVFYAGTLDVAGEISDYAIERCTLFQD